jgi:pimeloyl-ACP methyl ester carboxylesterase
LSGATAQPPWRGVIEVEGLAVHAATWSAAGAGPGPGNTAERRMLLLHGLGGTLLHWELVAGGLADRFGAVVTAIDLAGFGRTRASSEQATVAANARLVTALLERYGSAEIVGNSMGAAVATIVAAGRPELVTRLLLVTPVLPQPTWPDPPVAILPHNWPAAIPGVGPLAVKAYAQATSDELVVDGKLRRSFFDVRRVDPRIRARLIELTRERRSFDEAPYAYAAATRSMFWYLTAPAGSARDIARVRCPTVIVHGEQDRLVPLRLAQAALRRRPDWALKILRSCGHMPQLERPQALIAARAAAG